VYRSSRLLPSYTTIHRGVRYERRLIVLPWGLANLELLSLGMERETIQAEKRRRATSRMIMKEKRSDLLDCDLKESDPGLPKKRIDRIFSLVHCLYVVLEGGLEPEVSSSKLTTCDLTGVRH